MFKPLKLEYTLSRGWKTNEQVIERKRMICEMKNPIFDVPKVRDIQHKNESIHEGENSNNIVEKCSVLNEIDYLCCLRKEANLEEDKRNKYLKYLNSFNKQYSVDDFQTYGSSKSIGSTTKSTTSTICSTPDKRLKSRKLMLEQKYLPKTFESMFTVSRINSYCFL